MEFALQPKETLWGLAGGGGVDRRNLITSALQRAKSVKPHTIVHNTLHSSVRRTVVELGKLWVVRGEVSRLWTPRGDRAPCIATHVVHCARVCVTMRTRVETYSKQAQLHRPHESATAASWRQIICMLHEAKLCSAIGWMVQHACRFSLRDRCE
jgi:hypothetical protein